MLALSSHYTITHTVWSTLVGLPIHFCTFHYVQGCPVKKKGWLRRCVHAEFTAKSDMCKRLFTLKTAHFGWRVQNCSFHHWSTWKYVYQRHTKKVHIETLLWTVKPTHFEYMCNFLDLVTAVNYQHSLTISAKQILFSDSGDWAGK